MQVINVLLFSGVMGLLCAHLAKKRGKRAPLWFLLGFVFGVFGLILLYIVPTFVREEKKPAYNMPKPLERSDAWMRLWYYLDPGHNQVGPFEFPDFVKKVRDKKVERETLVWGEGMKEWKRLSELPEDVVRELSQVP